jgi:hypothetical protein
MLGKHRRPVRYWETTRIHDGVIHEIDELRRKLLDSEGNPRFSSTSQVISFIASRLEKKLKRKISSQTGTYKPKLRTVRIQRDQWKELIPLVPQVIDEFEDRVYSDGVSEALTRESKKWIRETKKKEGIP